jgi:serine phosphatase RsbU (regulator of sigma subunit)
VDASLVRSRKDPRAASRARGRGKRPKVLVVGTFPGLTKRKLPDLDLEFVPSGQEARAGAPLPDVVVLDGSLAVPELLRVLKSFGPPSAPERPAVLLMGSRPVPGLEGAVDDFVERVEDLHTRIQGALRLRSLRSDLAQKVALVEQLNVELDGLSRRMAEDLHLAGNVQRSLHPPPLHHPRLDVAREFIPVREIGGDYYDLVPLDSNRLVFAIGDVMGKGVPAALLAANLKASLRAQLQSGEVVVEELLGRVNHLFGEVTPRGRFSSLFLSLFHFDRGLLEYANAGHHRPFRARPNGEIDDLDTAGMALGLLEEASYQRGEVSLSPDDVLVFYSDGVTDRVNSQGDLYGIERLKEAAVRSRGDAARIALYSLLGELQGWSAGTPPNDDMTLVVTKVR